VRRTGTEGATPPPPAPTPTLFPRQARWLLLRSPDELRPDEKLYREHVLQADPEIRAALALAEDFGSLVRERQRDRLEPWLTRAERSDVEEFRELARMMRRDQAAVEAGLTSEWSSGQVEGQITKLKCLRRQMYGQGGFPLLRTRLLQAA
jgi:transposase